MGCSTIGLVRPGAMTIMVRELWILVFAFSDAVPMVKLEKFLKTVRRVQAATLWDILSAKCGRKLMVQKFSTLVKTSAAETLTVLNLIITLEYFITE